MTPLLDSRRCCRRNACSRSRVGIQASLRFLAFCNSGTQMLTGLRLWNSTQNMCVCGGGAGRLWERMLGEWCWWLGHLRPQLGSSGPLLASSGVYELARF